MPKGFSGLRDAAADREARRAAGGTGGQRYFKLADGEVAYVRFLEQGDDVRWAYVHTLPASGNSRFGKKVVCRDQNEDGQRIGADCPGCEKGLKRSEQGAINLIWRDAPVFQRDDNNKLVKDSNNKPLVSGHADQIAVWVSGPRVFDMLDSTDGDYRGLMSRDFKVTRKGTELNTNYVIAPANPDGGPSDMSVDDNSLAENKYDLAPFVEPQDLDSWGKDTFAAKEAVTEAPTTESPFARKRRD